MSLHKQSDVKNHLSPRYRTKIYLCKPVSDATGLSVAEPDAIKAVPLGFAEDFLAEHSSSGEVPASTGPVTGSISPQATAVSKNARA
jgi:D-tyrosyl-tRNA(Tyr) deacylase